MGQRRYSGIEGKATFYEEMKAAHEARKKAAAAKKTDKPTAAERVTAQGRRDNARAQKLAEARARARAKARAEADAKARAEADAKAKAAATDTTTTPRGRKLLTKPGTFVRNLQESNTKEAKKRIAETARLNEKYRAEEAAKKAAEITAANAKIPFNKQLSAANAKEAARRIAERSRLNNKFNAKEDAEEGKEKPWWRFGFKKGGLVKKSAVKKSTAKKTSSKKSIDGIARKGKTRAKHR